MNNSWNIISIFMKSLWQKAVANTMHHSLYVTELIEMCEYPTISNWDLISWNHLRRVFWKKNNVIFEINSIISCTEYILCEV